MRPFIRIALEAIAVLLLIVVFSYTIAGFIEHDKNCLCHRCEVRYYEERERRIINE